MQLTSAERRAVNHRTRSVSRSAQFASHFLPRSRRDALRTLIAFLSLIHEAMQEPEIEGARGLRLFPVLANGTCCPADDRVQLLRAKLGQMVPGEVELPVADARSDAQHIVRAASEMIREFELPVEQFIEFAMNHSSRERAVQPASNLLAGVLGVQHSEAGQRIELLLSGEIETGLQILPWLSSDGSRMAVATFASIGLAEKEKGQPLSTAQMLRQVPRAWRWVRAARMSIAGMG